MTEERPDPMLESAKLAAAFLAVVVAILLFAFQPAAFFGFGCAALAVYLAVRDSRGFVQPRHASLAGLLGEIELQRSSFGSMERLDGTQWHGRLGGRKASVELFLDRSRAVAAGEQVVVPGVPSVVHAKLRVAAERAPRLTVRRETPAIKRQKATGRLTEVEIGDPEFDDRYLLETPEGERVQEALRGPVKKAIDRAFREFHVQRIHFGPRGVDALVSLGRLPADRFRALLALLDEIASSFERIAITVHALSGMQRASSSAGRPRCAYCHGDLTGSERDLSSCPLCKTVLHDGCWDDCGGCPLLGCSGKKPERARVR